MFDKFTTQKSRVNGGLLLWFFFALQFASNNARQVIFFDMFHEVFDFIQNTIVPARVD